MRILLFCTFFLLVRSHDSIHFEDDNSEAERIMENASTSQSQNMQMVLKSPNHDQSVNSQRHSVDWQVNGVTNLGFAIDRSITKVNGTVDTEYLVYSPVSIASALYLLMLGSHGKTFNELSNLLGLGFGQLGSVYNNFGQIIRNIENAPPWDTQTIKFATALFVQNEFPIRNEYKISSQSSFDSEILNLDFHGNPTKARNTINNWVASKTMGKIESIMPMEPSRDTKVVLVSSLYFKSDWDSPFDSGLTKLMSFYTNGKNNPSSSKVQMMAKVGSNPYFNDARLNCEILGLPYKGKTVTFYVIIPHGSNREKLRELQNRLTAAEINRLVNSTRETDMIAAIPKMKLSSSLQLNSVLHNLGLRSLFDPRESNLALLSPGYNANSFKNDNEQVNLNNHKNIAEEPFIFSRRLSSDDEMTTISSRRKRQVSEKKLLTLNEYENTLEHVRKMLNENKDKVNPGLYVDSVLHQVVVDVNEKGTEAAATTSVMIKKSGTLVVKADVPFVFFIYHEATNMILFWGSVNVPSPNHSL